jgi:bifunctional non-homologous end joining protein LigD
MQVRAGMGARDQVHDGYRMIARRTDDRVRLYTRRGYVWTDRYPRIVEALRSLRVRSIMIDGEAVWCGKDGKSDFDKLRSRAHDAAVCLYGFDLIELDGEDLRPAPLEARKGKLEKLLARSDGIRFSEHLDGDGAIIFAHACKLGLEGIVSKRRDLPYRSGRCRAWVKIKNPASPAVPVFISADRAPMTRLWHFSDSTQCPLSRLSQESSGRVPPTPDARAPSYGPRP